MNLLIEHSITTAPLLIYALPALVLLLLFGYWTFRLQRGVAARKTKETALQQREVPFRAFIEASPVPYALNDDKQNITFLNHAFIQTFGYTLEDIPNLAEWWVKAYPEADYRCLVRSTWQMLTESKIRKKIAVDPLERHIRCKDGIFRTAMVSTVPLGEPFDGVHLVVLYDITERKKNEDKLLLLAARVFSEAHDAIFITDAGGTIVYVNPGYCRITGYSREEVLGQKPDLFNADKRGPDVYEAMWKALNNEGHWQGELWNRKKSGDHFAKMLTMSAVRDESGNIVYYLGIFSDITRLIQQQQKLELMAHYDPLTQLPNRLLFRDRFAQAVARCKREQTMLGICYLDLDGFKAVNDTLGHETGDQLLICIANRIKSILREEDTVSRLGGDEFVLLVMNLDSIDHFEGALARIHHAIAEPITINDRQISVSASGGMTIYPLDDDDAETLLRHADKAMYRAKQEGGNCFRLFDPAQPNGAKRSLGQGYA
jgi:diguanylate cyclase (GGDEF)-like protein/PAS domain S-box-containing protein